MRSYVSTIGYHETRVVRPVLDHGLNEDDEVILLRPHNDDKDGDNAVTDVRRIFSEFGPGVEVIVEQISYADFSAAVIECLDVLAATQGETIANFGGGPREIFLPFSIAAVAAGDKIDTVLQFTDIDQEVMEIQLPELMESLPSKTHQTFRTIADLDGASTLPAIAEQSGQSRSTVGRHLDDLTAAGAVVTEKRAKTRHVQLTLGGRLRLFRLE